MENEWSAMSCAVIQSFPYNSPGGHVPLTNQVPYLRDARSYESYYSEGYKGL